MARGDSPRCIGIAGKFDQHLVRNEATLGDGRNAHRRNTRLGRTGIVCCRWPSATAGWGGALDSGRRRFRARDDRTGTRATDHRFIVDIVRINVDRLARITRATRLLVVRLFVDWRRCRRCPADCAEDAKTETNRGSRANSTTGSPASAAPHRSIAARVALTAWRLGNPRTALRAGRLRHPPRVERPAGAAGLCDCWWLPALHAASIALPSALRLDDPARVIGAVGSALIAVWVGLLREGCIQWHKKNEDGGQ